MKRFKWKQGSIKTRSLILGLVLTVLAAGSNIEPGILLGIKDVIEVIFGNPDPEVIP